MTDPVGSCPHCSADQARDIEVGDTVIDQSVKDYEVIAAMRAFGGGFASALAEAARHAGEDNLRRIKEAWPDYWSKYTKMAKAMRK